MSGQIMIEKSDMAWNAWEGERLPCRTAKATKVPIAIATGFIAFRKLVVEI